jgi:serine/threonine protein kinase
MSENAPPSESRQPDADAAARQPERGEISSQTLGETQGFASEPAAAAQPGAARLGDILAPPQAADEVGRLGNYRILKELGAGGMGMVFLAEDPQLRRLVALKVMAPALATEESARQRFLREARATAALRHDHVVTIYQVAEDRGVPFLAMEFLAGESLEARLQREGRLPLAEALRLGREIAAGLDAAHEQGLIHRDVKPGNVFLESVGRRPASAARQSATDHGTRTTDCRVKLLDFGLAHFESGDVRLTQSGVVVGTPHYMSPEQAGGEQVDHRGDLFSLGCVLYRMTAGKLPFEGANLRSTLKAVMFEPPPPLATLAPDVPPALAALIERLLAKEPGDRPQSAAEVVEALAALEAGPASGVATTEYRAGDSPTGPPPAPDSMIPPPPVRPWRRRWVWAGAGLLALAAVVAFVVLRAPSRPAPPFRPEADEVLNRLVGTWSVQNETTLPDVVTDHGTVRYDWVANKQFLRAYAHYDVSGAETLTLFRHDADARTFRRWFFTSGSGLPAIQGPADGQWDATTATLTWRSMLPLFHKIVHEDHWIDADNFETRTEIKDHQGKVIVRQIKKMHRLTTNESVGPTTPRDQNRSAEMAVLDGLLGSWNTKADVTLAEAGNRTIQAESTNQAAAILAGRFMETYQHQEAGDRTDYGLLGWDDFRKVYRLWHFGSDGDAMEADGTWDRDEKTLTWKAPDDRFSGVWTLSRANEQRLVMSARDARGRRLYDVVAVSRRAGKDTGQER